MTGSAVSISNSSFMNDKCNGTGNGGGISAWQFKLVPDNTNFTNEIAGGNGGAIDSESSSLSILGGTFSGNKAVNGGAIYALNDSSVMIGSSGSGNRVTFTSNSASGNGGAIYANGNTSLNITNSGFFRNLATNGYGGAVYSQGEVLSRLAIQTLAVALTLLYNFPCQ